MEYWYNIGIMIIIILQRKRVIEQYEWNILFTFKFVLFSKNK